MGGVWPLVIVELDDGTPTGPVLSASFFTHGIPGLDGKSASFGSIDIPDYAEAIAQYRAFVDGANGNQPGDPKLLAEMIVALASQGEVPSRLVFGEDARQWAGSKVDQLRQEITRSADHG
ncbi:hypothetical protein [Stappia sp. MMSF_3263]|uniref:hypothetical protein n=1 Tax=Stappia sp. MMSF_3263 TaxID=3046693 RepID=UPI00273E9BA3|nr:hypothetical protein [Stappia sp. MMSF_3263]